MNTRLFNSSTSLKAGDSIPSNAAVIKGMSKPPKSVSDINRISNSIGDACVFILDSSGKVIHEIYFIDKFTYPSKSKYEGALGNVSNYYNIIVWEWEERYRNIAEKSLLTEFSKKLSEAFNRFGLIKSKTPFAIKDEFKGEFMGFPNSEYVCIGFESAKDNSSNVAITKQELKAFMNAIYSFWNPSDGYDIQVKLQLSNPKGEPYDVVVDPDTIILLNL